VISGTDLGLCDYEKVQVMRNVNKVKVGLSVKPCVPCEEVKRVRV